MEDQRLRFFDYRHLPEHLQQISRPYHALAELVIELTPDSEEQSFALRKLLESKDCAVRARLAG